MTAKRCANPECGRIMPLMTPSGRRKRPKTARFCCVSCTPSKRFNGRYKRAEDMTIRELRRSVFAQFPGSRAELARLKRGWEEERPEREERMAAMDRAWRNRQEWLAWKSRAGVPPGSDR